MKTPGVPRVRWVAESDLRARDLLKEEPAFVSEGSRYEAALALWHESVWEGPQP